MKSPDEIEAMLLEALEWVREQKAKPARDFIPGDIRELLERLTTLTPPGHAVQRLTTEICTIVGAYCEPTMNANLAGIRATVTEERILRILLAHEGKTVSRPAIFDAMYFDRHGETEPGPKILDVKVVHLRNKLKQSQSDYEIQTDWGHGYRLVRKSNPANKALASLAPSNGTRPAPTSR